MRADRRYPQQSDLRCVVLLSGWLCMASAVAADATAAVHPLARPPESLLLDIALAGERMVAVGEYGRIVFSDDDGMNWSEAPSPTRQMLTTVFFTSARQGWAAGHDGLILQTRDGGDSWQLQRDGLAGQDPQQPAPAPLLDIWFRDPLEGWAVGAFGTLLHTRDGGQRWLDRSPLIDNAEGYHYYGIVGDASGRILVVGEAGGLYRSLDGGEHWQTLDSPYAGSWFGVVHATGSSRVAAFGLQGHVVYSSDFGASWHSARSGQQGSLAGGTVGRDDAIVLVGSMGTVLRSGALAAGFDAIAAPQRRNLSAVCRNARGELWAAGQDGVTRLAPPDAAPGPAP